MKILIDATAVENKKTGVTQYATELFKHILRVYNGSDQFLILVKKSIAEDHPFLSILRPYKNVELRKVNFGSVGVKRELFFLFARSRLNYDLFHCLHTNFPLFGRGRSVVTIHDLKYLFYPGFLGRFGKIKSYYLYLSIKTAVRKSNRLIVISRATKEDLLKVYGKYRNLIEGKTRLIYESYNTEWKNERNKKKHLFNRYPFIRKKYFLYLGEFRPHKNIDGLVEAFRKLREREDIEADTALILSGKIHKSYQMQNLDNDGVYYTGFVSEKNIKELYENALAYCLVSKYEGFGLPILEAMKLGVPVITSNRSSMKEVAGDAALKVDPESISEIDEAMYRIYKDEKLRTTLVEEGYRNIERFSWNTAAERTIAQYKEIISAK